MYTRFVFLLLLALCIPACQPESSESDTFKKITLGTWLEEELWLDEDGDGVLTLYAYPDNCNTDDEYTFESGAVFRFNDGALHCEPNLPIAYTANWSLLNQDQQLRIDLSGSPDDWLDYEIVEISNNKLILNRIFPNDPNPNTPFEKLVLRR